MKQNGDKQWRKSISAWMDCAKLRVMAYWGPLVLLIRGYEEISFTCSQVESGWQQNSFYTPIGFTLTLDKIHGTRGLYSKINIGNNFKTGPVFFIN